MHGGRVAVIGRAHARNVHQTKVGDADAQHHAALPRSVSTVVVIFMQAAPGLAHALDCVANALSGVLLDAQQASQHVEAGLAHSVVSGAEDGLHGLEHLFHHGAVARDAGARARCRPRHAGGRAGELAAA